MNVFLILSGFVALLVGGEFLVRGAVAVAQRLRVSPLIIGLTLVGFGTSMPELLTSLQAALAGSPGIAVGNVVGSNIANILLILGIAALIAPMAISRTGFGRDGGTMAIATLLLVGLALWGSLGRGGGVLLVLGLAAYLAVTLRGSRGSADPDELPTLHIGLVPASLIALGGLVVTLAGARLLVVGAVDVAASLGVSEAIIGLTIVAVGTSLPELVTSVMAARKGHSDVAIGNIIGSNIFNILGILGVTAIVRPMAVPPQIAGFDVWVMAGAAALLIGFALRGWSIGRGRGGVLLGGYALYLGTLVAMA